MEMFREKIMLEMSLGNKIIKENLVNNKLEKRQKEYINLGAEINFCCLLLFFYFIFFCVCEVLFLAQKVTPLQSYKFDRSYREAPRRTQHNWSCILGNYLEMFQSKKWILIIVSIDDLNFRFIKLLVFTYIHAYWALNSALGLAIYDH